MKKVVGLDLGPNSIGLAVVTVDENGQFQRILHTSSRIIPMDAAMLNDFGKGGVVSQTSERTTFRSIRRLRERNLLRRSRLHRVLTLMGWLPEYYTQQLTDYGHIKSDCEPKLAWYEGQFLFQRSFEEMLSEFRREQPALFASSDAKIPYDWTIYYLRKKALTQRIEVQELAWILLNFNQKRGYYQLREEEEATKKEKIEEYHALKVVSVEATDDRKGDDVWYNVHLENGWIYRRSSKTPLDWVGFVKEFIVTTEVEEDGSLKKNKEGEIKRTFRAPKEEDWTLLKVKNERDIALSGKTVGTYIYDGLLQKPDQKIKGKLVRVVERKFYKDELRVILETQRQFHSEFSDGDLYKSAVEDLYRSNEGYRHSIEGRDLIYLLMDDILFYQRPLKTKKSQIADCKYESFTSGDTVYPIKAMPKSHPLYQEFRLWKFISQLKIFKNDVDVTAELLTCDADYEALYRWLNGQKEIDNKGFVKYKPFKISKVDLSAYRWNYVVEGDKKYPCNETYAVINGRLKRQSLASVSPDKEVALWHILYSVRDRAEIKKALARFARKNGYEVDKFVDALKGCIFESEYGAYSEKAIKKFLSLMRRGCYWAENAIDTKTRERMQKLLDGEVDEKIDARTREKCTALKSLHDFSGMDEWLASYVIYGRHAESADAGCWKSPDDITSYLEQFKQHSMRNPVVEQVVMETLRVVRDIWRQEGHIDEIHIELAREMKKTSKERERDTKRIVDGEVANYRIRRLLEEFQTGEYGIEDVRAQSPSHQTLLKIYEDYAHTNAELPDDIKAILIKLNGQKAKEQPTKGDIIRYKLWLEQQYRSPYTGEIIPLGKLFTSAYQKEHIIPRAHYTDNSLNNLVICEAAVNQLKGSEFGMSFIKNNHGAKVTLDDGRVVTIFNEEEYTAHIDRCYANNRRKAKNLRAEEVPDEFTSRQLNDTRYISRFISGVLSNIVREEGEVEATSKNVILTNGVVTDTLKKEWGLNDVWNDLMTPRFERLNEQMATSQFGQWVCDQGKRYFRINMPLELSRGFSLKRIDHRHHAMDAVVIACTTRSHINYLNNISASDGKRTEMRYQLRAGLCYKYRPDTSKDDYTWRFHKPWSTFTEDVCVALKQIVVSFKQNLRVINKATNNYQRYVNGKKQMVKQTTTNWAIRKSMHKDTVYGPVNLQLTKNISIVTALKCVDKIVDKSLRAQIVKWKCDGLENKQISAKLKEAKVEKVQIYYFTDDTSSPMVATRKLIGVDFTEDKIASITDSAIRTIMLKHLDRSAGDAARAFSPEGVEKMNDTIRELNNGKAHKPILKVRIADVKGKKFSVGQTGSKSLQYVVTDEGTNIYCAVYANLDGARSYESLPFNEVMERQKAGLSSVPTENEAGDHLLFTLSPYDLVYLPTSDQIDQRLEVSDLDKSRIYKAERCTGAQIFFVPNSLSKVIVDRVELLSQNKMERALSGEMIKETCLPIRVDRLGNIIKIEQ